VSAEAGEIHTIFATVDGESRAQALADAIENMEPEPSGVGCFEVDEDNDVWEVAGYFGENPSGLSLTLLEMAFSEAKFVVSKVPPEDWVAKVRRELTPVRAGRFTLHGGHDKGDAPPSAIRLQIEAAMAFGTGHHGTTRGCLIAMDTLARQGLSAKKVLDLGTGTGALAMGAAKLWKAKCVATDIDEVAVATARENIRFNGAASMIEVFEAGRATSPQIMQYAPYDLVFANILAAPLKRLAPQIAAVVEPGSGIILSGLLHRQAPGVAQVFAGWGMNVKQRIRLGEWTTLRLERVQKLGEG
jgi:ribosomal protein L11 methyltransferase